MIPSNDDSSAETAARQIVIDSNVLVGLLNPLDHWHTHSISFYNKLQTANVELIYFDCVITEVVSAVARRLFEKNRVTELEQFFDQLDKQIPQTDITWILSQTQELYSESIDLMKSSSGELNFHDSLIALICRDYKIPFIASYDADFDQVPWLTRISSPEDLKDDAV